MTLQILPAVALLLVSAVILLAVFLGARAYFRYRGKMLVSCPETGKAAAVRVDASRAAGTSLLGYDDLRLRECSRWPERESCGQECLSQIAGDPHDCLVWTRVAEWYAGRRCACCERPFEDLHWHDRRPALMDSDGKTVQWSELSAERLPEVFETHTPVCWNCHVAETFRREHPELVLDRQRKHDSNRDVRPSA